MCREMKNPRCFHYAEHFFGGIFTCINFSLILPQKGLYGLNLFSCPGETIKAEVPHQYGTLNYGFLFQFRFGCFFHYGCFLLGFHVKVRIAQK